MRKVHSIFDLNPSNGVGGARIADINYMYHGDLPQAPGSGSIIVVVLLVPNK